MAETVRPAHRTGDVRRTQPADETYPPQLAADALGVLTLDPRITAFLREHDPMALQQAQTAYSSLVAWMVLNDLLGGQTPRAAFDRQTGRRA